MDPQGIVLELSPNDKVPGIYLQTIFGIGAACRWLYNYPHQLREGYESSGIYQLPVNLRDYCNRGKENSVMY